MKPIKLKLTIVAMLLSVVAFAQNGRITQASVISLSQKLLRL